MLTDKELLLQDPAVAKDFREAEQRYLAAYQKANYTHFSTTELYHIFKLGAIDKAGDPVFFVFGMHQPYLAEKMERLYLLLIKWFEEQLRNLNGTSNKNARFTIVYFNNRCNSYLQYMAFRGVYRSLPLKYIQNLKGIIVVSPGLAVRTLEWIVLGPVNKHLRALTHYVESIRELEDYGVALTKETLDAIPEPIRADELKGKDSNALTMCDNVSESPSLLLSLDSQRRKQRIFVRHGQTQSERTVTTHKQGPFGVMKKRLQDYEMCDIEVPVILRLLINYLQMRPEALGEEGIFRRSVSIDDEEEAISHLYRGDYDFFQKLDNPHIAANLIKKFLVNLVEPIVPYVQYNKIIYNVSESNIDLKYLKVVMKELPKANYITLQFVLSFFIDSVVSRSSDNKMTSYNVAVVLNPCLFRSEKVSMQDLVFGKKLVRILETIFVSFDEIFGNAAEQQEVVRESSHAVHCQFQKTLVSVDTNKVSADKVQGEIPPRLTVSPTQFPLAKDEFRGDATTYVPRGLEEKIGECRSSE